VREAVEAIGNTSSTETDTERGWAGRLRVSKHRCPVLYKERQTAVKTRKQGLQAENRVLIKTPCFGVLAGTIRPLIGPRALGAPVLFREFLRYTTPYPARVTKPILYCANKKVLLKVVSESVAQCCSVLRIVAQCNRVCHCRRFYLRRAFEVTHLNLLFKIPLVAEKSPVDMAPKRHEDMQK